jgi:hypothetical protein
MNRKMSPENQERRRLSGGALPTGRLKKPGKRPGERMQFTLTSISDLADRIEDTSGKRISKEPWLTAFPAILPGALLKVKLRALSSQLSVCFPLSV